MGAFVATVVSNPCLDWLTGRSNPSATGTRYVSIWNGDPQGAGSEVINTITGSATRPSIAFAAASAGSAASNADVTFTTNAAGSGTVSYVALHTAATAGSIMASCAVTSKAITAGDSLKILSGNATVSIT